MIANQVGIVLFGKKKGSGVPQNAQKVSLDHMMAMTGAKWE